MPVHEKLTQYALQLGFPDSEAMTRVFEILYPEDDDKDVLMALPGTVDEISGLTGFSRERTAAVIKRLNEKGAIGTSMNKPDYYKRFPVMIELRDSTMIGWKNIPKEYYQLWETILFKEMKKIVPILKTMKINPMMRVIPIDKTIESKSIALDIDRARKIFKDAELITAVPCPCRSQAKQVGKVHDCPAPDVNLCMQVNGFAKPVIDKKIGEKLTNAEAIRRIGMAEDAGLVHAVRNNYKKDMFMCNCCSCCCVGLNFINMFEYNGVYAPSRFRAKVEEDKCTGCGVCEDRCRFNAISISDTAVINNEKCLGCGNCVVACPENALGMETVRPPEHIRIT